MNSWLNICKSKSSLIILLNDFFDETYELINSVLKSLINTEFMIYFESRILGYQIICLMNSLIIILMNKYFELMNYWLNIYKSKSLLIILLNDFFD